jgi:SAM-dependent methyltransferase
MENSLLFHEIAPDYDAVMNYFDYELSANICHEILKASGISSQSEVLEVGIGTGKFASELQKKGYRMQGIDCSKSMLEVCNTHYPEIPTEEADISTYRSRQGFPVIVSHAGPLRLNHLSGLNLTDAERARFQEDFGGLFFETYLQNEEEAEAALGNISEALSESGLLVMYVQSFPGREMKTRSTPDEFDFNEKRRYEKKTEYIDGKLHKTRTVHDNGEIIWSAPHVLTPLKMADFLAVANRRELEEVCLDPSNQFYTMRKRK